MPQSKPDRRRFLSQAAGGAAVSLTTPYFFTAASSQESAAPATGDRIRVAAIGVGGRGSEIGRQASRLGDLVACADVSGNNAREFAAAFDGKCQVYDDYRRILDRDDIQAITCATPDHWHTKIAIDALRAGKDVYCEKPLTLTIAESKLIQQVARASDRVFQVGTQQRTEYDRNFLKAVAIARSGRLGERLHAISSVEQATAGGPFPGEKIPSDLDWQFWLGPTPDVDFCSRRIGWDFRWWLEYSGGQVTDWGVHHTDIALWALGGEESGVVAASGSGNFPGLPYTTNVVEFLNGRAKLPHQFNVAETFDCQLELANGNTINLVSERNELIISGERGRIRVNRGGLTGKPVEEIAADPQQTEWLEQQVRQLYRNMPLTSHMGNFFHCMRTRELPISDVFTHCHSVNACHIANVALLLKRRVEFDSTNCAFVGDDEANLLLAREQRSPWQLS